jgi:hypothetical protein
LAQAQGQYAEATDLCVQSLATVQKLGNRFDEGFPHYFVGKIARDQGRYAEAADSFVRSLIIWAEDYYSASAPSPTRQGFWPWQLQRLL